MKIKLDFDHQMIEDKDRQIERLIDEKKALRIQLDNTEKIDKNEKVEKNERDNKSKKQIDKYKRQN